MHPGETHSLLKLNLRCHSADAAGWILVLEPGFDQRYLGPRGRAEHAQRVEPRAPAARLLVPEQRREGRGVRRRGGAHPPERVGRDPAHLSTGLEKVEKINH